MINDPDDPRLDDYRHLTDAARPPTLVESGAGAPHGIFVVEGVLALRSAAAPSSTDSARCWSRPPGPAALARRAGRGHRACRSWWPSVPCSPAWPGSTCTEASSPLLDRTRAHGCPPPSWPAALVGSLVLEGVNDNENVGSLFRNAAALGLDAVLLDARMRRPAVPAQHPGLLRVDAAAPLRPGRPRRRRRSRPCGRHGFRTVALTPRRRLAWTSTCRVRGAARRSGRAGGGSGGARAHRRPPSLACDVAGRGCRWRAGVDSLNVATSLAVVAAFAAARRGWT